MAAAIKALNAKIRANPALDYFCSTRTYFVCPERSLHWRVRLSPELNAVLFWRQRVMVGFGMDHAFREKNGIDILRLIASYRRLLGSRVKLWYSHRSSHGYTEGS